MAKVNFSSEGFYTANFVKYAEIEDFTVTSESGEKTFRWENVHYDCSVGHKRSIVSTKENLKNDAYRPIQNGEFEPAYLINTYVFDYERKKDNAVTAVNLPEYPLIIVTSRLSEVLKMIGTAAENGISITVSMGTNFDSNDIIFQKNHIYVISI